LVARTQFGPAIGRSMQHGKCRRGWDRWALPQERQQPYPLTWEQTGRA
jgi:hypothetical protein